MESPHDFDALRAFCDLSYECLDRRADTLSNLSDVILAAGAVPSPVHVRAWKLPIHLSMEIHLHLWF